MKISMKRLAALLLALVMVLGMLPVMDHTANAVDVTGLNDSSIGLSYVTGTNPNTSITPWTASGNTLTGACAGRILGSAYLASSNTLTITNTKATKAMLSFDYELSGVFGSVKIDDTTYSAAGTGSFEKELEAGASIKIVLTAKKQNKSLGINTINIAITNLALTIVGGGPVTSTFEAPAYGSYSVAFSGQSLNVAAGTASQTATNLPNVEYTLTATPGSGYKFVGWYNVTENKYLGTDATYVGFFETPATVKAIIVPEGDAVFMTGGLYYTDLNEAVSHAQANSLNQITLVQSGTLAAGNYTIPAGITLLIPKDTEYTVTGTDGMGIAPEYGTEVAAPYAFKTLTMAEGVKLTVNGNLDIEAKHTTYQGSGGARPYGGRVCGPYGAIYMNPNSSITLGNGANLYAWGYVYGDGEVTANSGANVYEIMQVTDFPGGGNMSNFVDTDPTYDVDGDGNPANDYIKTFPFSQYYVQNIEVALTLNDGAAEYVYISMTASAISMGLPVQFIGEKGMFNPNGGTIVKDYDPSTDRLIVDVNGDATMAGIAIDLTGTDYEDAVADVIGSSSVDSSTFILTLNSNITININSGTTTVKQDLHLLPGVEITVAKDATLVVAQRTFEDGEYDNLTISQTGGYNVYVWDLEHWQNNYVFSNKQLVAVNYSPTAGRYVRTTSDLKDVVIDINGTVLCEGFIYSTVTVDQETWAPVSGGAAIISSGKTGVIVLQNGCGIEDMAFCLDGTSSCDHGVEVDSAWLKNGDGSYLKSECNFCNMSDPDLTECQHVGATFNYCAVHDLWYTEGHLACTFGFDITWVGATEDLGTEEYQAGEVPFYKGATPTKAPNGCTVYTFAGWATTPNGEPLTELPAVTGEATYFAVFTESIVHVGDTDNDHRCNTCGVAVSVCADDNADHLCDYSGCKATLSSCIDNNLDHICDFGGCNATMSSCIDNDFDHLCDYSGCGASLSGCIDEDEDHICDYSGCKATLSTCIDNSFDHICDYAGCKATLSSCVDDNADHLCDYSGCKATLSSCVDDNADHICDYSGCKATVSSCADDDGDHLCDYTGCKATLSSCVDNDFDHFCDYAGCGVTMSSCADDNWDHLCDYAGCQATLSDCKDAENDHFCDYEGCRAVLSSCVDSNLDHRCDYSGCGISMSNCEDVNDDHICDYSGCQDVVSFCEDNDADHFCDYAGCQDELSSCEDLDEDHVCDYAGCEAVLSSCEDNDEDHLCDYAGCQAIQSSCEDNDEDHFCDYIGCQNGMSVCVDEDEDHLCDYAGCQAVLTYCEDADEDHICDYAGCKDTTSDCADDDFDHLCDYAGCKATLSSCVDAENDGDHNCDYSGCNAVIDGSVCSGGEATCIEYALCDECGMPYGKLKDHGWNGWECQDNGENHTVWCDYCWEYSYVDDHDFNNADHECDCGAVETFLVTFMNGDTVFVERYYYYNDSLQTAGMGIPAAPGEGYGWNGWYDANGNPLVIGMAVTSNLTFYATWKLNAYTVTWVVDNSTFSEGYTYGEMPSFKGSTDKAADGCTTYTFTGWDKEIATVTGDVTYTAQYTEGTSHTGEVKYTNNGNGTHTVKCECGETLAESEGHDYTYDTRNRKCRCGAIEEFKLTVVYGVNGEYTYEAMIPYWTRLDSLDVINNIPWRIYANDATHFGYFYLDDFYWDMDRDGVLDRDRYFTEGYMAGRDMYVEARYDFNGFVHDGTGWKYRNYRSFFKNEMVVLTNADVYENGSDEELEGIYMMDANGYRIENGMGRWYYLGYNPFSGITYEPNAEDIAYYENKGLTFIDEEMTWYYFGADGKLAENYTGLVGDSYVINGQAAWHIGLVEIDGEYYYFKGDEVNGGNKMVTGCDYYVSRNNTTFNMVVGGIYTFNHDGVMQLFHGITESELFEGKRHYIGGRLTPGLGLVDLITASTGEVRYFYVDSNGQLIVDAEYYIGANSFGLAKGIYYFDADGFLVMPEEEVGKNGFYFENGAWYYYVNGAKGYCAGLIETTGKLWFASEDAEGVENIGWVYVRSNGALATGSYYVTNVNGHDSIASGELCTFDDNGLMQVKKNGIVAENGGLYYYENNRLAWAAGLIEVEGGYIYVRSNGQVVAGCEYWITNVNDTGILQGNYAFDENGLMINPISEVKNGVVDGFYYVNDKVAYAAGVVEIEPGKFIYVRSNGAVATGKYWTTNHNGLLAEGLYDFGEDGILVIE